MNSKNKYLSAAGLPTRNWISFCILSGEAHHRACMRYEVAVTEVQKSPLTFLVFLFVQEIVRLLSGPNRLRLRLVLLCRGRLFFRQALSPFRVACDSYWFILEKMNESVYWILLFRNQSEFEKTYSRSMATLFTTFPPFKITDSSRTARIVAASGWDLITISTCTIMAVELLKLPFTGWPFFRKTLGAWCF